MTETSDTTLPVANAVPADRDPPESPGGLAGEHPGLIIGGGLALGLLAGALLPRGTARRLAQGAIASAALGGEASIALARKAGDGARSAASEAGSQVRKLEDRAGHGARRLRKSTAVAAGTATSAGLDLARAALRLLSSFRR